MHPYHMDWFMKEEEKRNNMRKENEIELLNLQFKRLIEPLAYTLDKTKYRQEEQSFNRQLVSCTIWNLGYRNNYINSDVLVLQAEWLLLVLEKEAGLGTIKHEVQLKRELGSLIHRIRNVDIGAYQKLLQKQPDVRNIL